MDDLIDDLVSMGKQLQSGVSQLPPSRRELGAGLFNAAAVFNENLDNQSFTPLFRSKTLNRCVFTKAVTRESDAAHIEPNRVATKISLPYSHNSFGRDNLFIFYGEKNFQEKFERAFNVSISESDKEFDFKILDILDSIPTFDPFLLKDRFEIDNLNIDENYTKVGDQEFNLIKNKIAKDFEKIIQVTINTDGEIAPDEYNKAASKLFRALWDLDELNSLRPLAKALGVSEENQKEYFYAWKGMLFYVYNYGDDFKSLDQDLSLVKQIVMSDGRGDLNQVNYQMNSILAERVTLQKFLCNYNVAFDAAFVERSQTEPFIRILNNARPIFWTVGTVIGRLDLYASYFQRAIKEKPSGRLAHDMRDFLNGMQR